MSFFCRHGYFMSQCDTCLNADGIDEFRSRHVVDKDDPDLEYYYLDIDERENYTDEQ